MTKAILPLNEMPKNCLNCELADCRYIPDAQNPKMPYGICCTAKEWKIADSWLDLNVNDKRPDWCPLKVLPEEQGLNRDIHPCYEPFDEGYIEGWNDCVDAIEGMED